MLLLALDSSGSACSAALIENGRPSASRFEIMARGQSEALIPMAAQVLEESGMTMDRIDAVAVCVGPGAFTGIRIGLAAARGLGLAAGKPVLGVAAPDVLAWSASRNHAGKRVMTVIDSRRAELWVQMFDENACCLGPVQALTAEQAAAAVGPDMIAAGDGAPLIAGIEIAGPAHVNAVDLGLLAELKHARGETLPPEPLYLREADITMGRA